MLHNCTCTFHALTHGIQTSFFAVFNYAISLSCFVGGRNNCYVFFSGLSTGLIVGIVIIVIIIAVVISILVPVLICCCLGVGAFSAVACLTKEKKKDGTVLKGMNRNSHNNNW